MVRLISVRISSGALVKSCFPVLQTEYVELGMMAAQSAGVEISVGRDPKNPGNVSVSCHCLSD